MTSTEHPAITGTTRTDPPDTEPPDTRAIAAEPSAPWYRRNAVMLAGVLLIAAQLVWRATVVRHAYFAEDDFEFVARAAESGLGWDYLMRNHGGHIMPGSFLLAWLLTRISPYNWGLTSAVTLALQAGAGLALLRLLRVLFGARPLILVPLLVFLCTPITISAMTWWATSLNVIPFMIATSMALAAHVRYVRGDRFGDAVQAAAWILVGMAFFLKAAALPLLLLAVTGAYLVDGRWLRATVETLRRHTSAWLLYAAVLGLYAILYVIQRESTTTSTRLPDGPDVTVEFAARLLARTFVPGALGGPWEWRPLATDHAVADTPDALMILALILFAALIAVSVWYRRRAWRAWVLLLGYLVVADMVPVSIGRLATWGTDIGLEARYVADAAPILALCLGLAFIPLAGERDPYRRPLPSGQLVPVTCGMLLGAFVVGSVYSVQSFAGELRGDKIRDYLGNARTALRDLPVTAQIRDEKVPRWVMLPDFGDYALNSRVFGPIASDRAKRAMREKPPYRQPLIFDESGRLRPMIVVGADSLPGPGRGRLTAGCWTVTGNTVNIAMASDVPRAEWMARIEYVASQPGPVTVRFGGPRVTLFLDKSVHAISFPLVGGGRTLQVTGVNPNAGICVGKVVVGLPKPAP
jgi:hypothetical protein